MLLNLHGIAMHIIDSEVPKTIWVLNFHKFLFDFLTRSQNEAFGAASISG